MKSIIKLSPIRLSITLYLLSLCLPAFDCNFGNASNFETVPGWVLLMLGWMGIFATNIGWFANITYFTTLVLIFKKNKAAPRFAIFSLI